MPEVRRTVGYFGLVLFACSLATVGGSGRRDSEDTKLTKLNKTPMTEQRFTNHLIDESSPYLLSHAHNPVDWYPWGEEPLKRARDENKPIFLSIGYAACHWCHVMERESFEDEQVAALLKEHFVSIKVDREQRPDLDKIYMTFTTAMTGSGGWPMSVFLTPDLKPFYAGTYFPPVAGYGRPSFKELITEISRVWREDSQGIINQADSVFDRIAEHMNGRTADTSLTSDLIAKAVQTLKENLDTVYGGFGSQPKFPHAVELSLFLRRYQATGDSTWLEAVQLALNTMADGGIFDHLGGGFARYSTDRRWLVPHFEKMLYDNGLLVPLYVEAYQLTGEERYRDVVRRTLDWLLEEMTDPTGGFYSALDADSEGEEGKFYVWRPAEIEDILGERDGALFNAYYHVTSAGNFEGRNILNVNEDSRRVADEAGRDDFGSFLRDCRRRLLKERNSRVRPATDDKILTSWNGLAVTALCRGYQITADERYLRAAVKNALFVRDQLYRQDRLTHSFRDGRRLPGEFLEDYAYYIEALINLYESDRNKDARWLELVRKLADRAIERFMDDDGFFLLRPTDVNDLIIRPRSVHDESVPAPASIMVTNLLRLNRLTDERRYFEAGEKALRALSGEMAANPAGMASAMLALDYYLADKIEIVVVGAGPGRDALLDEIYRRYLPHRVIAMDAGDSEGTTPLFEGRRVVNGRAAVYICRNSVCQQPVTNVEELKEQLQRL